MEKKEVKLKGERMMFSPIGIKENYYKETYPELKKIKEFDVIKDNYLRFVWWIANTTSPLVNKYEEISERIPYAIDSVWGDKLKKLDKENLLKGNFEATLETAIYKMSELDISARDKSKTMVDKIFDQFEEIVSNGYDEFKDKDDVVNYASYVSTMNKITEALPNLIDLKEKGFGIKNKTNVRGSNEGQKNHERFHGKEK